MEDVDTTPFQFVSCSSVAVKEEPPPEAADCNDGDTKGETREIDPTSFLEVKLEKAGDIEQVETSKINDISTITTWVSPDFWESKRNSFHRCKRKESLQTKDGGHHFQPFICTTCNKSFKAKDSLKIHVNSLHLGVKPWVCEICNRHFGRSCYLSRHKQRVHKELQNCASTEVKPFVCTTCNKSFSWKSHLKDHEDAVHKRLKPYVCELCNKKFSRNSCFTKHKNNVHKRLKPYTCETCKRPFGQKNNLLTHVSIVHGEVKGFKCKICQESFNSKCERNKHVSAIHGFVKRYVCEICYKSYDERHTLVRHMNRVHVRAKPNTRKLWEIPFYEKQTPADDSGIKPHPCEFCNKSFSHKGSLTAHQKKIHKELSPTCNVSNK